MISRAVSSVGTSLCLSISLSESPAHFPLTEGLRYVIDSSVQVTLQALHSSGSDSLIAVFLKHVDPQVNPSKTYGMGFLFSLTSRTAA